MVHFSLRKLRSRFHLSWYQRFVLHMLFICESIRSSINALWYRRSIHWKEFVIRSLRNLKKYKPWDWIMELIPKNENSSISCFMMDGRDIHRVLSYNVGDHTVPMKTNPEVYSKVLSSLLLSRYWDFWEKLASASLSLSDHLSFLWEIILKAILTDTMF